jgi:hypothetical protein
MAWKCEEVLTHDPHLGSVDLRRRHRVAFAQPAHQEEGEFPNSKKTDELRVQSEAEKKSAAESKSLKTGAQHRKRGRRWRYGRQ